MSLYFHPFIPRIESSLRAMEVSYCQMIGIAMACVLFINMSLCGFLLFCLLILISNRAFTLLKALTLLYNRIVIIFSQNITFLSLGSSF